MGVFADYDFPLDRDMYQNPSGPNHGHANCRGDAVIATAIIEALFKSQVLAKGLRLASSTCLDLDDCASLSLDCCQRSAMCTVNQHKVCVPFGPGKERWWERFVPLVRLGQ